MSKGGLIQELERWVRELRAPDGRDREDWIFTSTELSGVMNRVADEIEAKATDLLVEEVRSEVGEAQELGRSAEG